MGSSSIKLRWVIAALLLSGVVACTQRADMYDSSELSTLMREMEQFSKDSREKLLKGERIGSIPEDIWNLQNKEATRGEHKEETFQALTKPYLQALKGIERGDSQVYWYNASINACRSCHNNYCGGPLVVINQLNIESDSDDPLPEEHSEVE